MNYQITKLFYHTKILFRNAWIIYEKPINTQKATHNLYLKVPFLLYSFIDACDGFTLQQIPEAQQCSQDWIVRQKHTSIRKVSSKNPEILSETNHCIRTE